MLDAEKSAVNEYTKEIVEALEKNGVTMFLNHLVVDAKVLHNRTAGLLGQNIVYVPTTLHNIIQALLPVDKGYYGLISYLKKYSLGDDLVSNLNKKAGKKPGYPPTEISQGAAASATPEPKLKSDNNDDRYDNSHKGVALILNVEHFDDGRVRHGSGADFLDSQVLWNRQLGYKVDPKCNPTGDEIRDAIIGLAANTRLANNASLAVVVVMSHGNLEQIEGSDGVKISIEEFVNTLCNSPLWQHKPKLFFFQACRDILPSYDGKAQAEGEITEETIQRSLAWFKQEAPHDGVADVKHADSLLAFATSKGQPAYRREDGTGSHYIQEICTVFPSQPVTSHVAQMLEMVERNVSKVPIPAGNGTTFQQVATNINNLRRQLYL